MDGYEATRIVFSRIQSLDPENASKIMGLLLLQDHGEKEMIRLAFGPQSLLHSLIVQAKRELRLSSCSTPPWNRLDELTSPKNGGSTLNPASLPFYANGRPPSDVPDDFELHERFSFLDPRSDLAGSVHGGCVSDGLGFEDSDLGFGWGRSPYLTRGAVIGSPSSVEVMDTCNDLIRSKAVPIPQPPRLAHRLMGGSCFPFSPKRAAALVIGDDLRKLGRYRVEWNDLSSMASPASRQIYLTFPADSTFREEDVSNYFSTYGPVQDVRIPYQQKRMFGFVTFVFPETVKSILAKGNPHFVCDSRVLVKPYKEKGKVPDKYRTKHITTERDLSSPCGTPTGPDSGDAMDLQLGARALCSNTHELLWRRKFEEHALEVQSRRLMNLQLLDVKKHFHHSSPPHICSPNPFNQTLLSPRPDNSVSPFQLNSFSESEDYNKVTDVVTQRESLEYKEKGSAKEGSDDIRINLPESLEDSLPDSPFASPTQHFLLFDDPVDTADYNGSGSSSPSPDHVEFTWTLSDSFKTFNCQMPRLTQMEMLAERGGATCRVGI